MPDIKEKITRKQNSGGVEQENARTHAGVVPSDMEDTSDTVPIKEYIDRHFAQQAAENGQARAETQKKIEKVRAEAQTGLKDQQVDIEKLRSEMRAGFAELNAKFVEQDAKMEKMFAQQDAKMEKMFAQQDAKIEKEFAKMRTENAKQRVEDKASQLNQLRWIVGTIVAIGALIIASGFFT